MEEYFILTNKKFKEVSDYNPRYYYNIVANAEKDLDGCKVVPKEICMFGQKCLVKLYIRMSQDAIGQFIFMRSLLMTVYIDRQTSWKGIDGMFVCDSDEGNILLREMEDFKHDSWETENYLARGNQDDKAARQALRAINDSISDTIHDELQSAAQETQQIAGLEEILSIPTPKGEEDSSKKDDFLDIENIHDEPKNRRKHAETKKDQVRQPKRKKGTIDSDGRLRSNSGRKKKGKRRISGPLKPGSLIQKSKEDENGYEGIYAEPVDVSYRSWCQIGENNSVWHIIKVFSETEIDNALIQLYAINEDGKTIGVKIEEIDGNYKIRDGEEFVDPADFDDGEEDSTNKSKQVKNAISGVHINANIPLILKVRFNSSIRYSIRINSDKIINENENK